MASSSERLTIAFLWPAPADEEDSPTYSREGDTLLRDTVRELGFPKHADLHDVWLIPSTLRRGEKPKIAAIKHYWPDVEKKMQDLGVTHIFAMGAAPFSFLTGLKISDWGGRVVKSEKIKLPIIGVIHPDVVASMQVKRRDFVVQMRAAARSILTATGAVRNREYRLIHPVELRSELEKLRSPVCFDYETTGKDPLAHDFRLRCAAWSDQAGKAIAVKLETMTKNSELWRTVRDWLLSPVIKAGHNTKFEIRASQAVFGVTPKNVRHDTMVLHHVLNEDAGHKLEMLAYEFTDMGGYDAELKQAIGPDKDYANAPMDKLWRYCCGDADASRRLLDRFLADIKADKDGQKMLSFYRTFAIPTISTLARMENAGMRVSRERAGALIDSLKARSDELCDELGKADEVQAVLKHFKKERINPNSAAQVSRLLFREMGLEPVKRTKTGGDSTDGMEDIKPDNEQHARILKQVIEARSALHDVSVLEGILEHTRGDDCCDCDFYQTGQVTWRVASREPPFGNMPRNGRVKSVFVSRFDNGTMVGADYSQLEVRILGNLSGEPKFFTAFASGYDFHRYTAAQIYRVALEAVTDAQRTAGKRANFGVIFGIGAKKLAGQIGCSVIQAQKILDSFFEMYPYTRRYFDERRRACTRDLRVVSVLGQVRRLPEARHPDRPRRWHAQRQGSNHGIQAVGAALTLYAMNRVTEEFDSAGLKALVVNQVHDSLVIDCPRDELRTVAKIVHSVMTDETKRVFTWIKIPLTIDFTFGPSYGEQNTRILPNGVMKDAS